MADFRTAVKLTLIHEGGYVNNPNDSGGPTKYGITQKDLPGIDIEGLTEDQAVQYYSERYWKPLYSEILSQDVANKIFDMGVLFGIGEAVKLLQLALHVGNDGDFGAETLAAVNETNPDQLLSVYKTLLTSYTLRIALNHPQDRIFVSGWGRRINF
jgi:lysozyme family protein